ncbi:MAG: hypothetical protein IRY83_15640, partial [Chloroflexi bacterium]|nr:hypothetical protein [Chloroflexota bacterium]
MLRRWLIYGIWGAAAVALTGVGLWRASVAPPTRVEMRKVYRGDVVVNAGWDWSILLSGGNVLWPAGTVLPGAPAARAYPLAGKPILRAVPKVEVRGPSEQNLVVSVSAQAVLRVMNGDMEVWQKQLNGLGVTVRGSPAAYTGPALAVDMAGARTEMERINTALGLLDRYQGEVTFGLRAEVSGDAAGNVSVAAPVVLQPDTFNPPPSDKWRGQVRVPLVRQEQVEVRVPLWQRAAEEWPFFGGTAAALAVPALVVGRRRLAEASKEHHRYRRWITRGRLSDLDVRTVMVEDLRSLVRIAHDIGRRVIHDPNVGYGVPDGLVCYVYRPQQAPRIGELLVAQGVVAEADIAAARQQQVVWRRPLGECLVAMGLVDEVAVHAALAYQQQRVFLEPGRGTKKLFMPRMLLPIAVLGERPDHTLALAVPDPSIPRDIVEAAVGRPVWLAVCREKALASAGAAVVSGSGEMTARGVGRLGAQ